MNKDLLICINMAFSLICMAVAYIFKSGGFVLIAYIYLLFSMCLYIARFIYHWRKRREIK